MRPAADRPVVHRYGPDPAQFLELSLPAGNGPAPVVVVLHGGFWRATYGIELARPLAADLTARGWAAVAVEYRRVGAGGGWPQTLEDVAAAVDALPDLPGAERLDRTDVTAIGHSAGGQLAAWAAGRARLPAGAPGAGPRVRVRAAVLQAAVLDLVRGHEQNLGNGAVAAFLGGSPSTVPGRYATTDPVRLVPTGAAVLAVHGAADTTVPLEQSERYADAAGAAGDRVQVVVVPGNHMDLLGLEGQGWRHTLDWLGGRRIARSDGTTLGR